MPNSIRAGLLLGALLLLPLPAASAAIIWHWQDRFSVAEQEKLQDWIQRTVAAVEARVAPYPFDLHIHFYRRFGQGEPVPWAETRRYREQGVDFHVDPDYPQQAFLDDWTAPHELSHLLIPYLGRDNAWYAEGFASYMQYQVMNELGVISAAELADKYRSRINRAASNYHLEHLPFVEAASRLRARREFSTLYWGGAAYFFRVDQLLKVRQDSLLRVLRDFVHCCRRRVPDLNALTREFDRLSESRIFSRLLDELNSQPGFPLQLD